MLEKKLRELAQSDVYPFHMPGHKRQMRGVFPYELDITEIEEFDNLHHAQGILKELQQQAARMYQSKKAYYLVNGSTCGILAAISAAVKTGDRILVARNCHKAVYNAIYLRQLKAEYVYPVATHCGIQGQIPADNVRDKLEEYPDIAAIVITSPTYDGIVSDIQAIAQLAHERGIPLIVDQAHGAHFALDEAFPDDAIRLGADAVIMSVHKTLPAPTQTALLHLCSERIDASRLEQFLGIYETSSPSYVLMAAIEKALQLSEAARGTQMRQYIDRLRNFREEVRDLHTLRVPGACDFTAQEAYAYDIGKLLIQTGGTLSGKRLQEILLQKYHLQTEMASGDYVLAMTSFLDTDRGFARLAQALHEIDATLKHAHEDVVCPPVQIYRQPVKVMELEEARESRTESIALANAQGRISAAYVYLYPPGIPIIVPGERIDRNTLDAIRVCLSMGLDVEGLTETDRIIIVQNT